MEEWKNYPFDTRYQISSYGNIRKIGSNLTLLCNDYDGYSVI